MDSSHASPPRRSSDKVSPQLSIGEVRADRILFVVPPNIDFASFTNPSSNVKVVTKNSRTLGAVVTDMPLGVLSLSAYVMKHSKARTRLVDFNVVLNKLEEVDFQSFEDLFSAVLSGPEWLDFNPTIIGISALFSPSYQNVLDIAHCCREIFPKAFILAGGFLPTNTYSNMLRDSSCFDALCFGEGEKALARFVNAADKQRHLEEDASWVTRRKAEAGQTFSLDFIVDLDEIPFLDYDISDLTGYALNPTIAAYPAVDITEQSFHVMTSRGCIFRCSFCAQHTVHGRTMRYYSIDRIRADFKRLKSRYGVQTIIIEDDHFMARETRAHEILNILMEFGMTAFFPNSLALYALKRPMLEALKRVGVNQLVLAVESGSSEVLHKIMRKPLKLSIVEQVTRDCREIGIYTDVNILIGLPGETRKDIEDSIAFLKTLGANWYRINVATPLVGSEMLAICIEKNYLKGDYNECDYKKAIIETEEFSVQYIQEKAYAMNLELNFVANSDVRLGDHRTALKGFENAIRAKRDHAFAHHYAAQCYEKLGEPEKAQPHRFAAKAAAENPLWRRYLEMFRISV